MRVSGDSRLCLELGLLAGATPEGVTKAEGNREAADDNEGGEDIEKDRRSANANAEPAEHAGEGLGLEDKVAKDQKAGAEGDQARVLNDLELVAEDVGVLNDAGGIRDRAGVIDGRADEVAV